MHHTFLNQKKNYTVNDRSSYSNPYFIQFGINLLIFIILLRKKLNNTIIVDIAKNFIYTSDLGHILKILIFIFLRYIFNF
jgi:hypothetical protein